MKSTEDRIKDIEAAIKGLDKLNATNPCNKIDRMADKLHNYIFKRWSKEVSK